MFVLESFIGISFCVKQNVMNRIKLNSLYIHCINYNPSRRSFRHSSIE